jgi:hypothetical protein
MNAQPEELEPKQDQQLEIKDAQPVKPNLLDEVVQKTQGILISEHGLDYTDIAGLWRIAKMIWVSKLFPKGLDTPEAICIAIAKGRSVGLMDPFQAVESIGVINGKACLYGDAPLAICRQHPAWDEAGFEEYWEVQGERIKGHPQDWTDKTATAVCITRRKRGKPREERFAVSDAIKAGLWGASGKLYGTYPQRMLKFRARGYNLRDNFGDSLKGLAIRELYEGDEITNGDQPKTNITDLNAQVKEKQARNKQVAEPIRDVAPESTAAPEPLVTTTPEPPKSQPSPKSAPIPRKKNESPAFRAARLDLQNELAMIQIGPEVDPHESRDALLKEVSQGDDGYFLTLDDIEQSSGMLEAYQRAVGKLREMNRVKE